MDLKEVQKHWNAFGKIDPMWAILTWPDKKENKWPRDEFFKTGVIEVDLVMKYVALLGIIIPHRKALDFGCGIGRLTQALACYFDEVHGVDISPSMIELAKQYNHYGDRCKYWLNELDHLKLFNDNNFDFIYTIITLQHLEPQYSKKYIKEFLRILTPGGLLIFHLPELQPLQYYQGNILKKLIKITMPKIFMCLYRKIKSTRLDKPTMETYGIKREEILQFLEENGSKIIEIQDLIEMMEEYIILLRENGIEVDITLEEIQRTMEAKRGIDFRYCVTKG